MPAPRAWQRMLSGRRLNLLDPSPLDIEIDDIAQGLSRVARWNGQTSGDWAFSVAQHSLLVEELVRRLKPEAPIQWLLTALLHDGPEYVVGDMITPFKSAIGPEYKALEKRLLTAIHLRFALPAAPPRELARSIKQADRAAAYLEATQLAGFAPGEAKRLFGDELAAADITLQPLEPDRAKDAFLARFTELGG